MEWNLFSTYRTTVRRLKHWSGGTALARRSGQQPCWRPDGCFIMVSMRVMVSKDRQWRFLQISRASMQVMVSKDWHRHFSPNKPRKTPSNTTRKTPEDTHSQTMIPTQSCLASVTANCETTSYKKMFVFSITPFSIEPPKTTVPLPPTSPHVID